MALIPLKDLIQLKPRPETTLALETSIQAGVRTVQSYRFTRLYVIIFGRCLSWSCLGVDKDTGYKQNTALVRHICSARLGCS